MPKPSSTPETARYAEITREGIDRQDYLVSMIILNWNQLDVTCAFLESTRHLQYRNYEILVCDMASDLDPTERITRAAYPNTIVMRNAKNLGSTGGNNWGIRNAKGRFVFLVNNDTEVTPGLIENLLYPFADDVLIGSTCPKIKFFDAPDTIQYAGFNPINIYTGRTTAVGSLQKDDGRFDTGQTTHGAHGCAMMVKREVIDAVGIYPEEFFIYYEEWDWSYRILAAGYKIYYEPTGVIFHKESITMGKGSPRKLYFMTRNRILFMRRNTPMGAFLLFVAFFVFLTIPKELLKYTFSGKFEHLRAFVRGVSWNLTHGKTCLVR
jgi:GT2 family glycosyltransferase